MNISKSQLRKYFRDIRSRIPAEMRVAAAESAAEHLISQAFFQQSSHIACYFPIQHEFDTSFIINAIWKAKKQCYLPVLRKDKQVLQFVCYDKNDALHFNRYAIPEPMDISRKIEPTELDLVIVPLIAFDMHGYRLGTGGGYYDYTFEFLKNNPISHPVLFGLGYEIQQTEEIPAEPWDIMLHGIITEKKFINFSDKI